MLTARWAVGVALSLVAGAARAQSDEPEGLLARPERLTVGVADDLLGQLSPDGGTLYFVSNRNQTSQIFAQNVADGRAKLLFDDNADVTWPRVSPDGKQLLYISFGERALGQLCIRNLPDGADRRCLAEESAVLQAEWVDRSRVVVLARPSIHGDLRLADVAGSKLSARPLLDRNLTGPAVSPDGQWLVYVPVERDVPNVGPAFASHGGQRLEAVRLESPQAPPTPLKIDLPGLTGQPAFARDGRSIYIVQFIDDSNRDGVTDANDHGILFRVPFSIDGGLPVAGPPEQLTEASYDCEYPAPTQNRLLATCGNRGGNTLDIYALPLDGEVPVDWTADRLASETLAASTPFEEQLLTSRRLVRETTTTARRLTLLSLVMLHLELEQYRAAGFYAEHVADLRERVTEGLTSPILALVDQRRAMRDRERGVLAGSFAEQARTRLVGGSLPAHASPVAIALDHVVKSEIADSIGDKAQAREQLEAVALDANTPAPVVLAYYERADALYRELDDREALVGVCRRLSENAALTSDEQLRYARAAVRAMQRGLPEGEAGARLARERAGLAEDSELAFALDVAREVLAIRDARPQPAVTDGLVALYARQARAGRRRALVDEAVERASQVGADDVAFALAQRTIEDVRRGTAERRVAERLYRRVMTARAYRRAAEGRIDEARAAFDAIVEQTGSYEAVVGSIEVRLGAGERVASVGASYAKPGTPRALEGFARAYLLAKELPDLEGEDAAKASADALALLRASWADLGKQPIAQALQGALLHDRYTRAGDLAFAERANVHYGIALELMGRGSRFRAMVLEQLGILHTQVGNYRIAVGYLEERDQLPYTDGPKSVAVHLAHARALLHVGREADAATAADKAVAMMEREPALAAYRDLALDRDAVCNLAAERFARAVALYDTLIPRLDTATGPSAGRNRFVARISRAAAEVGAGQPERALADLDEVERELANPTLVDQLRWPRASADLVVRTYGLIAAGLRAGAYRESDRPGDEARALAVRHATLQGRFVATQRAEYERDAMLTETHLALNARDRHDLAGAASWASQALARADDLRARAHGQVDNAQLDVLWLAAQLTVEMKTPIVPDLEQRLEAGALAARHDPALRSYDGWFGIYLPIVGPTAPR